MPSRRFWQRRVSPVFTRKSLDRFGWTPLPPEQRQNAKGLAHWRKTKASNLLLAVSFLHTCSGLDSALFGISLTNYCYYYFYEFTKSWINKAQMSTIESMSAGAVAGSCFLLLNFDLGQNSIRIELDFFGVGN